jgi:mono/diheme cytochrome c family protein/glucose/arabinose dehydrogenase
VSQPQEIQSIFPNQMIIRSLCAWLVIAPCLQAAPLFDAPPPGEHISLIGNGLGERMQYFSYFETGLQLRYPTAKLTVRNLCYPGDTPVFRPRAGRANPWAFDGAEKIRPDLNKHLGEGHYPADDEWLTLCKTDTLLAFFGFNESFDGPANVERYKAELEAFVTHTQAQKYNGSAAPKLVLISPIAFENLSATHELPDGKTENANLKLYTAAMQSVAEKFKVGFVDLFTPTLALYESDPKDLTINGFALNQYGDQKLAEILTAQLYAPVALPQDGADPEKLRAMIIDKAWFWQSDHRILNGVHAYGRRYAPYGDINYPLEIEKLRKLVANRDEAVWQAAQKLPFELAAADAKIPPLPAVVTNFNQPINYLAEKDALSKFTLMDGFKIELFASETQFPDLANPVQMSFDSKGRLWVSVLHSYPHYKPGDPRPNDKILIFEDTDGDGRADKETVFADHLQMPTGFELAPEGVYVSEQPNLLLLKDTDGDGRADTRDILMGGFDSHDTHHANSTFTTDASGAIFSAEGLFLHSQVETPYGPQRCNGAGIWRFDPKSFRLDRYVNTEFCNPWGIAFDDWEQCFIADASTGQNWWALPISPKVPYGYNVEKIAEFAPKRARPTSGAEFIHSRHFPDALQGGYMVNNTIGFLGTSIHTIYDDDGGYNGKVLGDLLSSSDPTFRPCDLEFAPDGSLYVVDWCNALIGHMQHSARDPNRDHSHGRIYRVTYPSRPLVTPTKIDGASIEQLLEALKEPEYRTRFRARRELRGRDPVAVIAAVKSWVTALDPAAPRYEHHLAEALWAIWAQRSIDLPLLEKCLAAKEPKARAAAVNVLRFTWQKVPNYGALLSKAAGDPEPLVRLQALVAASWMVNTEGAKAALEVLKSPISKWMPAAVKGAFETLRATAEQAIKDGKIDLANNPNGADFMAGKHPIQLAKPVEAAEQEPALPAEELALWRVGREVYKREAHCATCHQPNGKGMDKLYPPLVGSEWVVGDEQRLIKLVLKGLWGHIEVKGVAYDPKGGIPPMMGFGPLLKDNEVAGVLTYIRNNFENRAPAVKPELVTKIREEIKAKVDFYTPEDLLQQHPFPK